MARIYAEASENYMRNFLDAMALEVDNMQDRRYQLETSTASVFHAFLARAEASEDQLSRKLDEISKRCERIENEQKSCTADQQHAIEELLKKYNNLHVRHYGFAERAELKDRRWEGHSRRLEKIDGSMAYLDEQLETIQTPLKEMHETAEKVKNMEVQVQLNSDDCEELSNRVAVQEGVSRETILDLSLRLDLSEERSARMHQTQVLAFNSLRAATVTRLQALEDNSWMFRRR